MELTFEKIGDWYISEFEVASDFNLHIEKEPKGDFYLYQRTTSSGQYDIIQDFGYKKGGDNVIDFDFQALVYPKWIKIKSAVKPLIATITTDGEVNEVVYQAKEIEITSNGTTKVTADTGYTALGSVNVKVNVPSEGGGSATPTELQRNDVNFFDYDGTLLYAYTWDEAKNLTELPVAPSHDGMTFKEWNYTLEDIKAQGTDIIKGKADIGACYIDNNGVPVNNPDNVMILARGVEGVSSDNYRKQYTVVSIPNTVTTLYERAFDQSIIKRLVVPASVVETDTGYGSIYRCVVEEFWRNGEGLTLDNDIVQCKFGLSFEIPNSFTNIGNVSFDNLSCYELVVPNTVYSIETLSRSVGATTIVLNFSNLDHVVTLMSYKNSLSGDVIVVVPDYLYDYWVSATNWSLLCANSRTIKSSNYNYKK